MPIVSTPAVNRFLVSFLAAGTALLLCACGARTSMKQTWKSPSYSGGEVGTLALLAVTDRGLIRAGLENRFATELERTGNRAVRSYELLSLPEIEQDHDKAATLLEQKGAEAVLITRLITSDTQYQSVHAGDDVFVPVVTGFAPSWPYAGYYWGGYYTIAFEDMSTVWSSQTEDIYLETSLFRLSDGKPIWSCITKTVLRDTSDYVPEMDRLTTEVISALRTDGLVK